MLEVKTTICSVDEPPVSGFSPSSPPEYSRSTVISLPAEKLAFVISKFISKRVAVSLESVTVLD